MAKRATFTCKHCKQELYQAGHRERHEETCAVLNRAAREKAKAKKEKDRARRLTCTDCRKVFKQAQNLENHKARKHAPALGCKAP